MAVFCNKKWHFAVIDHFYLTDYIISITKKTGVVMVIEVREDLNPFNVKELYHQIVALLLKEDEVVLDFNRVEKPNRLTLNVLKVAMDIAREKNKTIRFEQLPPRYSDQFSLVELAS